MYNFKQHMQLNEVFVHGKKALKGRDPLVVAYRKDIWVLTSDNYEEQRESMMKAFKQIGSKNDYDDIENIVRELAERSPNIVVGTFGTDGVFRLDSEAWRQATTSTTMQKLIKALKIKQIGVPYNTYEDSDEYIMHATEFGGKLKDQTFYHGTDMESLSKILKSGLRPMGATKTNFERIRHEDKVFVTLNKEKAYYHAMTSANNNNNYPVIIGFKLPDVSKLVSDFDVAMMYYDMENPKYVDIGYTDIAYQLKGEYNTNVEDLLKKHSGKIEELDTKLGVFGYVGRIPASHIEVISYNDDELKKYIAEIVYEYGENPDPSTYVGLSQYTENDTRKVYQDYYKEVTDEYEEEREEDMEEEY